MLINLPSLQLQTDQRSKHLPLGDAPITIGRDASCVLMLDETRASRLHCVIEKSAKGYHLRDLQSSNGTWVNEKLVLIHDLVDGDVIRIGATELKFIAAGEALWEGTSA